MRKRKDIAYGRELTGGQIWAAYRQETQNLVVSVLTSRVRPDFLQGDDLNRAQ